MLRSGSISGAIICLILMAGSLALSDVANGQSGVDLDGLVVHPIEANAGKVVVLVFLRRDCPVSSRYAPVIQQISAKYADSAKFLIVFPDKAESAATIRDYLHEYGYSLPALRDPAHELAKIGHVRITPEVAVFNRDRQLVYDGRIDDWYVDLGRARTAATTHELVDAIEASLTGKTVAKTEVRGVGCYISDLD